jgi:hypothetical protein
MDKLLVPHENKVFLSEDQNLIIQHKIAYGAISNGCGTFIYNTSVRICSYERDIRVIKEGEEVALLYTDPKFKSISSYE